MRDFTTQHMQSTIGASEWLQRTTYGETSDGKPCCVYCGAVVSHGTPDVDDDEAWSEIADKHCCDCRWVETRAHGRLTLRSHA